MFWKLWEKYNAIPERFDYKAKKPSIHSYPLRPEFVESSYMLYTVTKNPFYLEIGKRILTDLNTFMRAPCGFAAMKNIVSNKQEDRMESFALSETLKYLYLLFDTGSNSFFNYDFTIWNLNILYVWKTLTFFF